MPLFIFNEERSGKSNSICLSPVLIHGFHGGGKLEKRERKMPALLYVVFSTSTPGERFPKFISLTPVFVFFFLPFPITLNYQQVLKEEEGTERRSSAQSTILLPTAAFPLPFLAEERCFLAFGVFQLLGIQNICGFLKNNFGNCVSAEALGLEMPSVT